MGKFDNLIHEVSNAYLRKWADRILQRMLKCEPMSTKRRRLAEHHCHIHRILKNRIPDQP